MRSEQTGDAVGRPGRESSLSGAPGAKFFCGKLGIGTKKEKRSKKERNGGLWKLTPLMGIRSPRGFPQRLGKHKTLSTVPTRPDGGSITGSAPFERQRSTLNTHSFGQKDGEQLNGKCANSSCLSRGVHPIPLCPVLCLPCDLQRRAGEARGRAKTREAKDVCYGLLPSANCG